LRIDAHQYFTPELSPDLLEPILKRNRFDATVAVAETASTGATRWLLDTAAHHEYIRGVVGWAGLFDVAALRAILDEYQAHPKFRGLYWGFDSGLIPASLEAAARRGLSLDMPPKLALVPRVAERWPEMPIAIAHLGRPSLAPQPFDEWARLVDGTARCPNVYAKISGLITDAPGRWSAGQLSPYVSHAFAAFGPGRIMFGSDWPAYLPEGTWKEALAAFTQAAGPLPEDIREQVLGDTASRFYRLSPGATP
jgi:L-fuconolactonase